jgi:hypothetical protein
MLPETDFEYLLHGEPVFVEARLRRLGFLSAAAPRSPDAIRNVIAEIKGKYDPGDTGPSYVHELATYMISNGIASETAVALHRRGARGLLERSADRPFLEWIGESERYMQ